MARRRRRLPSPPNLWCPLPAAACRGTGPTAPGSPGCRAARPGSSPAATDGAHPPRYQRSRTARSGGGAAEPEPRPRSTARTWTGGRCA